MPALLYTARASAEDLSHLLPTLTFAQLERPEDHYPMTEQKNYHHVRQRLR